MRRAEGDEHGVLAVDGVADDAAVEDVAGDDPDPAGLAAELLRGASQRGHVVTALQRALHQQPPGAAGRSDDEYLHARMVPGCGHSCVLGWQTIVLGGGPLRGTPALPVRTAAPGVRAAAAGALG